jgi:hypothetical protein
MQTPSTNRPAQLQGVPEELRPLIDARITAWDQMPAELRQELLDSEAAWREHEASATPTTRPAPSERVLTSQRWQAMPDENRSDMLRRFEQFFTLTAREQQATLQSISNPERRQIEATLDTFRRLSPAQRAESVRSLQRYADLSAEERRQFLQNAERWNRMAPDQRQAWRELVRRLSLGPPALPGSEPRQPPMPGLNPQPVTNGN